MLCLRSPSTWHIITHSETRDSAVKFRTTMSHHGVVLSASVRRRSIGGNDGEGNGVADIEEVEDVHDFPEAMTRRSQDERTVSYAPHCTVAEAIAFVE